MFFGTAEKKKKAFCEAVQKEKDGTFFVMCFGNSRTEDKESHMVRARRDSNKNSVVVISKATEYYDI